MVLVNILAVIILILSFLGGLKEGTVKQFFSLVALVIAIPVTGSFYYLIATILAFLPGTNWEKFVGFFITLAIISVILHFIFLVPRKITQKIWKRGALFRLLGGLLNALNASIGMVVFTLVLGAYPIIEWLERAVTNSNVLLWLVEHLSFVLAMLPEVFQDVATLMAAGSVM